MKTKKIALCLLYTLYYPNVTAIQWINNFFVKDFAFFDTKIDVLDFFDRIPHTFSELCERDPRKKGGARKGVFRWLLPIHTTDLTVSAIC